VSVLVEGEDGRVRCGWTGTDADYRRYHDEEWGTPLHGDRPLFEKICLEGFQAGLSWITILRRRPGFRDAFAGFEIDAVAEFDDRDVARLLEDTRIIRNRAKIDAAIANARVTRDLVRDASGALDELVWSFAPPPRTGPRPRDYAGIPTTSGESEALSTALRERGFRFVGPTTMYALMQSAGLVDDHLEGCWRSG
jgi:DNA-3-methyladenine glycosylase I